MSTAAPRHTEADRLALLHATRLLDSEGAPAFDAIARMAARQTGCPVAAINLVDAHRLFALARHGLVQRHLSREGSFCGRTLLQSDVHVVNDETADTEVLWRFYAGMPVLVEGLALGTVCVMDHAPRAFDREARAALRDAALAAAALIGAELASLRFRRQEARVRTASLAGTDWLWETDQHGRIQWVSSGLQRHTGMDPMGEIGLLARDLYTPRNDETRASWDRFIQARQRREPFSDAIAERDTPRGRIAVSISGTPVFNSRGEFMGYRGASRNVTRQLALETQARHDEQLLRQAFEAFHAGVMITDPHGRIVYANRHWRARVGVDKLADAPPWPELLRQRIDEGRYRDGVGREEAFFQWRMQVVERDEPVVIHIGDTVALCRDVRLPDGSIVHFSTDITRSYHDQKALKAQKAALAQSEERWKFALEGTGDGVWDWEIGRPEAFFAPRWKAMIGFDDSEMGNLPSEWVDRVHPEDRQRVFSSFIDYCHHGQGIFQSEFRMRHKAGHDLWILSRGKIVSHDAAGRPARIVGTHSDITMLKQAERALRDKQIAEAANQAKSEFLSRMSHEIRTPLNAVRGFAQLLAQRQEPAATGDSADYLRQILLSTELLSELVNDVLDLQQIEAGAVCVAHERVSLADVVRQCVAMLEPMAAQRQVLIDNRLDTGPAVCADRRRLQQVLTNLLSNAIKYNHPGGIVRLSQVQAAGQAPTLSVEDTGPGLNADQLARLFQPFERLGQDTAGIEGTGLGLIITRSLTEAMGGRLEIRSQPGHGTRVYVTLPPADNGLEMTDSKDTAPTAPSSPPPDDARANAPAEALACTPETPLRVLYVEDNRINALLFQEALRPFPELWLEVAEDGQMAMGVAREHRPEVLVIDAHLPGMTGFEVLRALRTLPGLADTPAYMCSADALPEDIERAREEGFVGYWTKPIDIEHVTEALLRLARQGHTPSP